MKKLDICLSPTLYPYQKFNSETIVVVIDIFRATSTFCVALSQGASSILPLATIEETLEYKNKPDFVIAGERNGYKLDGFELSNSPFDFIDNPKLKDKNIAFTTTNGTQAIALVKDDAQVVIGSFLNISSIAKWLCEQQKDTLLLCAGWKNLINYEDTLFAGALAKRLVASGVFSSNTDSFSVSQTMYDEGKDNLMEYIYQKSPRLLGRKEELHENFIFCLQQDLLTNVPIYKNGVLVNEK